VGTNVPVQVPVASAAIKVTAVDTKTTLAISFIDLSFFIQPRREAIPHRSLPP
jgi:hypothetical protein